MRPEILFPLFAPATTLAGAGPKLAPLIERVAGPRVRDVAFLCPQKVIVRSLVSFTNLVEGEVATVSITIDGHQPPMRPQQPWRIRGFDGAGFVTLAFFGVKGDYLTRQHPIGARRMASGKVERFGSEFQIVHPDYLLSADRADELPEFEAIYPATGGLTSRSLRKIVLEAIKRAPDLPEWQDVSFLVREKFPAWREALEKLHAPKSEADLSPLSRHRRRLAYDELLAHQLALARRRLNRRRDPGRPVTPSDLATGMQAALPFALTGAQARTLSEIREDLASGERMGRLVQGDVGSGKTVVAALAMADVAAAGRQCALMAPSEILARQHFETLLEPLAAQGVLAVLLTGRDRGSQREHKLAMLASGAAAVAVGTHALFQDDVEFHDLALAVIDEQHRFGVNERRRLQDKGAGTHLLAMSATPIPRTLELTIYGDLDVSRLDEKPPGRTPIATRALPSPRLPEVVARLKAAIAGGAQAFWVCPLVAESEDSDLAAAEDRAADLRQVLGPIVGLVHGRMAPADKDSAMARFTTGELSVLVATTVIEVGVDVPAASIMVIEHADRFGLAQLHQLRGRVGRGSKESACLLIYDPPLGKAGEARLDILRQTDDGFLIAEKDLELRGGGDPLGLKQSGLPAYRFADPAAHRDLIAIAADDARLVLARDPGFNTERGKALTVLEALFDWKNEGGTASG